MNSTDNSFNGIWGIILFLIVAGLFSGGFNGFGGTGNGVQLAEIQNGLYNQTVNSDLNDIKSQIANTNVDTLMNINSVGRDVLENKYAAALANQQLQAQMDQCCCSLKTTIIEQNQATRDLINANLIASLEEQVNDLKASANNAAQTQLILSTMGRWYANAPYYPNGTTLY